MARALFPALLAVLAPVCALGAAPADMGKTWVESVRPFLVSGSSVPLNRFDELFGDPFFARRWDPFRELEAEERRLEPGLSPQESRALRAAFQDWLSARMDLSDVPVYVRYDKDWITVRMKVPGLVKDSASVRVDKDRVRLSYSVKTVREERDTLGRVTERGESTAAFEKFMALPSGADPAAAKTGQEEGAILLTFARLKY